ncbi:hypothetical protein N9160_00870 [bacterium]|nr:hypothetical protein [bacterium]
MVNSYINKDNYPFLAVDNGNTSFSQTPCYTATLLQNEDFSDFIVCNQDVNSSLDGFLTCYKTATKNARGSNSHINNGVERVATVATKISDTPEPALKFVDGLLAEYGSVAGNSNRAKQVLLDGVRSDIKSEALHQVELLKDDIDAQRLVLQSYTERMIAVGELILDKKDRLTLSEGRTPARRGKAGAARKGGRDTMDYRRAAAVLSCNHAHYAKHGSNIISQAEAIRICQDNREPVFLGGHGEASLRRSVSQGLRKHFPNEAKHWTRTKKP